MRRQHRMIEGEVAPRAHGAERDVVVGEDVGCRHADSGVREDEAEVAGRDHRRVDVGHLRAVAIRLLLLLLQLLVVDRRMRVQQLQPEAAAAAVDGESDEIARLRGEIGGEMRGGNLQRGSIEEGI